MSKHITINILDRELTLEEAKALYQELHELFGGKNFYQNNGATFRYQNNGLMASTTGGSLLQPDGFREFKFVK